MKKSHPLLFGAAAGDVKAGAGNGTNTPPMSVNDALRAALRKK
jgi:hypothetical protein